MNLRRILPQIACAVLAISFFIRCAPGQEQRFADANCAVTLPPDWEDLTPTRDKPEAVLAAFGTHDQRHSLMIVVYDRGKSSDPLDRWFADDIDRQCGKNSSAGHKVSGKFVEVAGGHCYERHGALIFEGQRISTLVWAIPTGEGTYFLQATAFDAEVEDALDVRQALASFRFLHPPLPISKTRTLSQYLRYYGVLPLGIGILIAAVLFVIGLCLRLKRHARTAAYAPHLSTGDEPPPLPSAPADPPPGPYDY